MTSNVSNRGIAHLRGVGDSAACRNRRAHIIVAENQFNNWPQCKRCATILNKWRERREQRSIQARGYAKLECDLSFGRVKPNEFVARAVEIGIDVEQAAEDLAAWLHKGEHGPE